MLIPSFLLDHQFVVAKGTGKYNPSENYQEAKEPVHQHWQSKQIGYEKAHEYWLDDDTWVGVRPAVGEICLDIDHPDSVAYVRANIEKFPTLMETPNGYHAWFKYNGKKRITGATKVLKCGIQSTFRTRNNYVIVLSEAAERKWVKSGELQGLPEEFFPVADLERVLISNEIIKENEKLVKTEVEGLSAAFVHLLVCLRLYSFKGNKHFARLKAGQLAGVYRLPDNEVDMLRAEVTRLSNKPQKAVKTFMSGVKWGRGCPAKTYQHKRQERVEMPSVASRIKAYCLRTRRIARTVKNETLQAMGISPREMGKSQVSWVAGKSIRVHALEKNLKNEIYDEMKITQKEQQKQQLAHTQQDESDGLQDAFVAHWVANMAKLAGIDSEATSKPPGTFEPGDEGFDMLAYVRAKLGEN